MENNFKVGDVVVLNSGGPRMTIVSMGKHENNFAFDGNKELLQARCFWFNNIDLKEGIFTVESLILSR